MNKDIKRYLDNLKEETNAAALYRALAEKEKDPKLAEVYRRLSATEAGHARAWAERIQAAGGTVPEIRPSWQTRIYAWAAGRFGTSAVLPTLAAIENGASNSYVGQPEAKDMVGAERSHAVILREMTKQTSTGMAGGEVAQRESWHKTAGGNALRAAVLGASDGLLSNFSLVMGVAGAQLSGKNILLTGFAGLLAGAISMALGEWISVQSSRELYQKQIRTEKEEIESAPEEEVEELVLIYQARGLAEPEARSLATRIMSNPESALDTLTRDELGIDPEELGGSAWEAAITSFLLFAAGAIVPVIPFLFLKGVTAAVGSAILSAMALFIVGSAITLFTGRSILYSGLRQVIFGLVSAVAVFLIGRLIGVSIAG
jgi:vacuolar iron transporter family protein